MKCLNNPYEIPKCAWMKKIMWISNLFLSLFFYFLSPFFILLFSIFLCFFSFFLSLFFSFLFKLNCLVRTFHLIPNFDIDVTYELWHIFTYKLGQMCYHGNRLLWRFKGVPSGDFIKFTKVSMLVMKGYLIS